MRRIIGALILLGVINFLVFVATVDDFDNPQDLIESFKGVLMLDFLVGVLVLGFWMLLG